MLLTYSGNKGNAIPHVLITDDDANFLSSMSDILMAKGFKPFAAHSGEEALDVVAKERIAVALIDLRLKGLSGLDVLRAIRKLSPETQCIMLTGHATQNSAIEAIQIGAYGYFQKPFDIEQVLLSIRQAVEKQQADAALRESQRQVSTLMSNLPGMAYRCKNDPYYTMEFVSAGCLNLTGYAPEMLMDADPVTGPKTIHAEDREKVWETVQAAMQSKRSFQMEYRINTASGSIKWVWEQGQGIYSDAGELLALEGFIIDIDERKRAEQALSASETEMRTLFAAMQDDVIVIDAGGVYRKFAPTRASKFILSRESMLGKNLSEVFDAEQAKFFQDTIDRVLTTGKSESVEYALMLFNGQQVWYASFVEPMDERQTLWMAHDITNRKEAEQQALLQSTALNSAANAIIITDREGRVEWVNPAFSVLTGYSFEEALHKNPRELVRSGKHDEQFYKTLWDTILAGQVWHGEVINRRKDGSLYDEEEIITPVKNTAGEITHFIGVKQDITERKKIEKSLIKRSSQLALINEMGREIASELDLRSVARVAARLLHNAFPIYQVVVFVLDQEIDQLVLLAREGAYDLSIPSNLCIKPGVGMVGWVGQSGEKLLSNDIRTEAHYKTFSLKPLPTKSEISLPLKVGSQILGVLDVQSPELQAFGEQDVTALETLAAQLAVAIENAHLYESMQRELLERRRAEEELKLHRVHLEDLVNERTGQLIEAKENAEAASQAKSAFLATMSHEIRTPLNGVLGLTHLVLQTELNEKQRDYLAKIRYSGESLLATINDILDFSKIEAGKVTLEQAEFNLDNLLQSLAGMLAYKAQEKDLKLIFDTAADVPQMIHGDEMRLRQVLTNLVGNAIKFTETGEVLVRTRLSGQMSVEAGERQLELEFSVQDSGIGMNQAQLELLFQPFTQADTSTSRKYGGTGLGLTISERLVSLMGGTLLVQSQPGEGSTFSFTISTWQREAAIGEIAAGFVPNSELSGLRVLVVDENQATRLFLQEVLHSFSFHAELADSAESALELLEKQPAKQAFELLLMDNDLSGEMNGLEVIRRIKARPQLAELCIMLLVDSSETGQPDPQASPDGSLVKPISRSQLFNGIMLGLEKKLPERVMGAQKHASTGTLNLLRGRQILLVEDNEINQMVATEMLQSLGLQVRLADSGEQAMQILNTAQDIELVLMDIQMPGMDGYQTTAQIRTDARYGFARFPIVAMTAHALAGDREKTLAAGFNDYLPKPVDMTQLTITLLRWLVPAVLAPDLTEAAAARLPQVAPALADPVLNKPSAIARLGDNLDLYKHLLVLFKDSQGSAVEALSAALEQNDMELARRLAHNLKGTAGTIGAEKLAGMAKQMEGAIAALDSARYTGSLQTLGEELDRVLEAIKS